MTASRNVHIVFNELNLRNEYKEENIVKGKEMLLSYCKTRSHDVQALMKPEYMKPIMEKYGFKDWESVCAAVGHGGLKEGQIINKMQEFYDRDHAKIISNEEVLQNIADANKDKEVGFKAKGGIVVEGIHDVAVRFSKCCSPIPGDEIVGFVTRGRGVSIHRTDCVNVLNLSDIDRDRLIDAEWQKTEAKTDERYMADINLYSNNRNGLLADITKALTERNINITSMNVRTSKQGTATISLSFEISNKEELISIIDKLRAIDGVIDIERTMG